MSKVSFAAEIVPAARWKVLVAAESEESAVVTLLPDLFSFQSPFLPSKTTLKVLHKFGEGYVDVTALKRALDGANILPEDIALINALSGNSTCPSTRHVPKKRYVQAYFEWWKHVPSERRTLFRPSLLSIDIPIRLIDSSEICWDSFESLLASAFLYTGETNSVTRDRRFQDMHRSPQFWAHSIRTVIATKPNIKDPSMLMPEKEDVELQVRRAVWTLRYWKEAYRECCHLGDTESLAEDWGFQSNGYPLYEPDVDVKMRAEIIKASLRTFKCTIGFISKRCSFRNKDIPSPCVLCQCKNCKKQGDERLAQTIEDQLAERQTNPAEVEKASQEQQELSEVSRAAAMHTKPLQLLEERSASQPLDNAIKHVAAGKPSSSPVCPTSLETRSPNDLVVGSSSHENVVAHRAISPQRRRTEAFSRSFIDVSEDTAFAAGEGRVTVQSTVEGPMVLDASISVTKKIKSRFHDGIDSFSSSDDESDPIDEEVEGSDDSESD